MDPAPWWRPRDVDVAARSAALLMTLAATVLILFAIVGPSTGVLVSPTWSAGAVVLLLAAATGCRRGTAAQLARFRGWPALPAGAVLMVLALNAITGDTSAGAQVFLCFPVLWAASQLRLRAAGSVCALAVLGNALLAGALEPAAVAVPDVVFVGVVLVAMTVVLGRAGDQQEQLVAALRHQAGRDPLTGLATRRVLDAAVTRALSADGRGAALVLVDVDRFKSINDAHGHPVGDQALIHLAELLAAQVRTTDAVIGRLGGDELALLLPDCSLPVAVARAEAMVHAVRSTPLTLGDGQLVALSVSVGVAHVDVHGAGLEELYVAADGVLYAAKRAGRDRVVIAGR